MSDETIKITKRMLANWFTANNRSEREDSLWKFLKEEESRQLQYKCPACEIPILVGKHSITIDRNRIEIQRMLEIEDAAKALVNNTGVDCQGGMRPVPVESELIEALKSALAR